MKQENRIICLAASVTGGDRAFSASFWLRGQARKEDYVQKPHLISSDIKIASIMSLSNALIFLRLT